MRAEQAPQPSILPEPEANRIRRAYSYPVPHRGPNYALFSLLLDTVGTLTALLLASLILQARAAQSLSSETLVFVAGCAAVVWAVTFLALSIYDTAKSQRVIDQSKRVFLAVSLAMLVLMGLLYLAYVNLPRTLIAGMYAFDLLFLVGWRWVDNARVYRLLARHRNALQRVLIVGANGIGGQIAQIIQASPWSRLEVFGYVDDDKQGLHGGLPILGKSQDVRALVEANDIEEVVVALPNSAYDRLNHIVTELQALPIQVRIVPGYLSLALYRTTVNDLGGLPLINLRDPALTPSQRMAKRAFDLATASLILLTILPVLAVIALAIKLDSKGPVLFKQVRVGENGKMFKMYKFRSMVVNAEQMQATINKVDADGNTLHKFRDDPRVTRVGRFIRKTSLDELPQFFNVITGDMSLVGPRPELPWLVENYEPWQRQRFSVPQGITGWWQVNGRSDLPCHLNTDQDLYYIQNYSFMLDIQILLKTVPALLKGKGAF